MENVTIAKIMFDDVNRRWHPQILVTSAGQEYVPGRVLDAVGKRPVKMRSKRFVSKFNCKS